MVRSSGNTSGSSRCTWGHAPSTAASTTSRRPGLLAGEFWRPGVTLVQHVSSEKGWRALVWAKERRRERRHEWEGKREKKKWCPIERREKSDWGTFFFFFFQIKWESSHSAPKWARFLHVQLITLVARLFVYKYI